VKGLNPAEYQILCSIQGIGKVYASGILAEMGTIQCFRNYDALAKYCGIVWKENQSGEFDGEGTPMNKAGNHYLRYYMIEAPGSVVSHELVYHGFYSKKLVKVFLMFHLIYTKEYNTPI